MIRFGKQAVSLLLAALTLLLCACAANGSVDDPATAASEQSDRYLVRFNDALYTPYLYGDELLTHNFDPCKTLLPDKQQAVCVYEENPDETMVSVKVQTYADDPEHNFLYESGTLFGDRLLRKTTYTIPDYRDPETEVARIVWSENWSDDATYSHDALTVWDDPQTVSQFMQFVCDTAADPNAAQTKPADKNGESRKTCFIEFKGIEGRASIGFLAVSTDGTRCMYFSDFPTRKDYENTFAVVPFPDSLQSVGINP